MAESDRRLPVSLLVAGLVAVAVVSMVVDRRGVIERGREFPAWLGSFLDIAAPVQDAVALPFEVARDAWSGYISLLHVKLQNDTLQREVARLSEENLQLRETIDEIVSVDTFVGESPPMKKVMELVGHVA